MRWEWAGELDSPVPTGRVRKVRDRRPAPLAEVLATQGEKASVILLADNGFGNAAFAAFATACRRRRWPTPRRIGLADGSLTAAAGAEDSSDDTATNFDSRGGRSCILERPDLAALAAGHAHTALRSLLALWPAKSGHRLLATLAATDFTFRHGLPGWLLLSPAGRAKPLEGIPAGSGAATEASSWELRWNELLELAGEDSSKPVGSPDSDGLFTWLSDPALITAGGVETVLSPAALERARLAQPALVSALRRWIRAAVALPTAEAPPKDPSPRVDGLVSAVATSHLYRLLFRLDQPGDAGRRTLADLPVDRWLCLLAAAGYGVLAPTLACLAREDLTSAHLVQVPPLEHANLRHAVLAGADLYHANLARADLRQADLRRADLSRAHLKGADLRAADLRDADLSYSCLEQADLRGAQLTGADLTRAHLDDALIDPSLDG